MQRNILHLTIIAALTPFILLPSVASAEELEAFTEPYKRVALPAAEIGVIAEILVAEGDRVTQKQIVANMDDEVLQASLEVARAGKEALGARRGAEVELELRAKQLESFRELRERGNATQREVDRAEGEHLQAHTRLQSIREELEVRRLEYERVKAQLKQRRLESPIDGYVVQIDKEEGEFVSPTDPIVMHVVQLNTLKSVFFVPMHAVKGLQRGQTATLLVGYDRTECKGIIEFVSPVAEYKSESSVRVKLRIPNEDELIPSGVVCRWDLEFETPPERTTQRAGNARK